MKALIAVVVFTSLGFEGCYSFSALNDVESVQKIPPPEETILVHTYGGRDIKLEAYHFVEVREPSEYVYGVGERAGKGSSRFVPFCGKIRPVSRNTEIILLPWGTTSRSVSRFVFTLEDGSIVRMEEPECIVVDSAGGPGLWYVVKQWTGTGYAGSAGRITFDDIKSIEVKKLSWVKTGLLVIAISPFAIFGVGGLVYWIRTGQEPFP
jgi:hypothetical protein